MKTQKCHLRGVWPHAMWLMAAIAAAVDLKVGVAATTEFRGGPLSALTTLSPTLTFDHLLISGPLQLPAGGAATLRVNDLTIGANGSVDYNYSPCEYLPAPSFTVEATRQVVIHGPIGLNGRSGTRITGSATCNSCSGCAGGQVRIVGRTVTLAAEISTRGGAGSTMSGSGCGGGAAGSIHIEAAEQLNLDGATLTSQFGKGGVGYFLGEEDYGANGTAAEVRLISHHSLRMTGSAVTGSGRIVLQAEQTAIWGPITGGTLDATIGGIADQQGPQVEVVAPAAGTVIRLGQPIEVRIRAQDLGTGVREIQIDGLGQSLVRSATGMVNGVLTVSIAQPLTPAALQVTAWDNRGNSTTCSVAGLSLTGQVSIREGETVSLSGDLIFGPDVSITIAGDLLLKRGVNHKITGGSLHVTATGSIEDEPLRPEGRSSKAPSLEVALRGPATIEGRIDLSGNEGWDYYWGESGGAITIQAAGIFVAGSLKADGAYAAKSSGGHGGAITLNSSLGLEISGILSAEGARAYGWQNWGGDGGNLTFSYLTTANLAKAALNVTGGFDWEGLGKAGQIAGNYAGGPKPAATLCVDEIEPNNLETNAQALMLPVRVIGSVLPAEVGGIGFPGGDDFEDVFQLQLANPLAVQVLLVPAVAEVDLDLIVLKRSDYSVLGYSLQRGPGLIEWIENLELAAGSYLVLVSQYGDTPATESSYQLYLGPAPGNDSDRDGMSDWWELTHFGALERNGSLDADLDTLSDRDEHGRGTHPWVADTDGDGRADGWEVAQGYDPLAKEESLITLRVGARPSASGLVAQVRGSPGQNIRLQRSQDLKVWEDWITVTGTGLFQDTIDRDIWSAPARFYRALCP